MLIVSLMGLAVVTVPLMGGRLRALADLRFRHLWALVAALVIKVLVLLVFPYGASGLHAVVHVGCYALAGFFVFSNRQLPGMWMLGLGGALNLTAIVANGGVMPSPMVAFESAGLSVIPGRFSNSAPLADPNLAFLGDIFATPANWPLHNVFSIGDLCILLGAAIAMHRICGSRLVPSGRGQFTGLLKHPDFVRVWAAQGVSNLGDWVYSLAVIATVAKRGGGPHALAILLVVQVAPAALAGFLGGPMIDRLPRKTLMIAADLLRGAAVMSLLFAEEPSLLAMYTVAAFLGLCGSVFQPSLQASLPNLVPSNRIVAANAMVSATYNLAVMAGPVVGGLLVANLGPRPAFMVNALSFAVSAILVVRARIPQRAEPTSTAAPARSLMEGFRYSMATPLVRGALIVIGMIMVSSSLRTPLEPLFVMDTLGLRPEALGLVGGAWGLGMLLGSIGAPAAARRWRRELLLFTSIAAIGLCVLGASRATVLAPMLFLWVISGAANGLGSVAYDSLLQERTPDAFRGRVMAGSEAVFQVAFLVGVSLSGWFGTHLGIRSTFTLSGVLLLLTAAVCRIVLAPERGSGKVEPPPQGLHTARPTHLVGYPRVAVEP